MMKWITKPIIYISIVNILICGIIFSVLTGYKASQLIPGSDDYKGNIAASVAIGVGTLIYIIIIGCLWNDIKIGASIMEAAGDFMSSNLKVIVVPIIATVMFLPFILWWAATIIYLFGMGTPLYV
jgi:Plasma-membrane choline transporter